MKRREFLGSAVASILCSGHVSAQSPARKPQIARLSPQLRTVAVGARQDFASIGALRREDTGSLLVLADIMFVTHRQEIVNVVSATGVPAMYPDRAFIEAGGLAFYGAGLPGMYRHAATYVDRILRGAKPSDLPVEQPTSFELVINLRAARATNIAIPPTLLARADEVIE
jgi:putative tryptophan/tyrosine transport system substrate-binding protein